MDPSVNPTSSLTTSSAYNASAPEQPTAAATDSSAPVPLPTIPLPMPSGAAASSGGSVSPIAGLQVAEDKDIIEPEWVNKAKEIVMHTQDDPYQQSEQLTAFKADYMQKRYNKIVKLK